MKILFTGGGTGGHVFPLIAIIREIRNLYINKDLEFYYIGPKDEFGSILLSQEDVQVKNVADGKVRRYLSFQNIIDVLFKIPWSFIQTLFYFVKIDPTIVFSKGGSSSLPVAFWAWIFRVPIFIHESDVVPGLSNRVASRWARKIFVSFPRTEYFNLNKVVVTGNPIRSEIFGGSKEEAKRMFDLTMEKPVFLFMGGSQGAEFINDFLLLIIKDFLRDYEIIHVCGINNMRNVQLEAQVVITENLQKYYHVYDFLDEDKLKNAYKAADFVVCRAGSGSIFELAAAGVPSILVPLPGSAGNHQAKNSYVYAETGAAIVMEQDNMTPTFFTEKIKQLFVRPEALEKMREEALRFSKPMAAKTIARNLLEFLRIQA